MQPGQRAGFHPPQSDDADLLIVAKNSPASEPVLQGGCPGASAVSRASRDRKSAFSPLCADRSGRESRYQMFLRSLKSQPREPKIISEFQQTAHCQKAAVSSKGFTPGPSTALIINDLIETTCMPISSRRIIIELSGGIGRFRNSIASSRSAAIRDKKR